MDVIYGLIPGMIIMGLLAVGVLFWAAKSGQFEDMEGEASRILMDDDVQIKPKKSGGSDEQKVAEKPSDET
jgi:cbb3-type cytochrome oxidase maturation protein